MSDMKPLKIAINGNTYQDEHLDRLKDFFSLLYDNGVKIEVNSPFLSYLSQRIDLEPFGITKVDSPSDDAKAVISIGGDGTFLHSAQWVGNRNIPILGINTGHLGFLSVCRLDEMHSIIDELLSDTLLIEHRGVLQISADNLPDDVWPYALNEVAILKQDTSSMITVKTEIDNFYLTDYLVDGLIVSTATGSTGYNMSVGGPILQPTVDNFVLSPIAPHSLTMRPLVVSSNSTISATTLSRSASYRVSLDGRSFSMPCNTTILVKRADFDIFVMHRKEENFAATIRKKLLWGAR